MPAPPSAAPPKPTAAPAPAAPAPAAPTTSPAPAHSSESGDNPFAELESAWSKVETQPKPSTEKQPKPAAETPPKPAAETHKPEPTEKPKPFTAPKEMRDHISKLEGDIKTRDTEMSQLRGRLQELEGRAKEHGTLTERITAVEKERDDAMAQVRALRQEKSPEFIKQYDKPFKDAAEYAKSIIEDLTIVNGEGQPRQAKWDDFSALYQLPASRANKAARELFGDDAQTVINHLQELHRLDYNRNQALKDEQENAKKRSAEDESKAIQQREQIQTKWVAVNKDLADNIYHDDPEDKESAAVRSKALAIYDAPAKTLNERIVKDAHIRHIVADRAVLKRSNQLLKGEIEELKKELEGFKNPQPGKGKRTPPAGKTELDWEEDLRQSVT